jgi:vancomycin resistance protein YoaR
MEKREPHLAAPEHIAIKILAGFLAIVFLASFFVTQSYKDKVAHGVFVGDINIGEKTKEEVEEIYNTKNELMGQNAFVFSYGKLTATASARDLEIGYDINLILDQGFDREKRKNVVSEIFVITRSFFKNTYLSPSYAISDNKLEEILLPLQKEIFLEPVDAEFVVKNGRVVVFQESKDGRTIDMEKLREEIMKKIPDVAESLSSQEIALEVPIKILEPKTTTEESNEFGIMEIIGTGKSWFEHSIPNRIFNLTLASIQLSGILVAPGEEFSFNKYLGDVSKFTGYKEAYIIKGGRTILGDGGGVCQVSTTLFRALLNSGLPITERYPHSYRVSYYEQNSPPGIDATVFSPWVDLKFKNDTENHILIQSEVDPKNFTLTFTLWGKKDSREVELSTPVITNVASPPPALYEEDPTLPLGEIKQIERAIKGANVSFKRTIKKNGEIITETYRSIYPPWQAVFLVGTKQPEN